MELPKTEKGYKISGTLVPDLHGRHVFYTIAANTRQAIDRFYYAHSFFLERDKGEVKIEIIPINNIPKDVLENIILEFYSPVVVDG